MVNRNGLRWLATFALIVGPSTLTQAQQTPPAKKAEAPRPDDEAVALAFVRENHPELTELLAQLKPMKPAEYQKAVRELAQTSRTLADLKPRDPKRYELGLKAWKARSKVELLAAQLASCPSANPELEMELRQAIEAQVDQEIVRLKAERALAEERLKRVSENLERTETRRGPMVLNRYKALLKTAEKTRKLAAAKPNNINASETGPKSTDQGKKTP